MDLLRNLIKWDSGGFITFFFLSLGDLNGFVGSEETLEVENTLCSRYREN